MKVDTKELRSGDVLGRYQLLLPVAKGGMGQVWAARLAGARGVEKLFALKTILPSGEDSEQLEAMLLAEASLASLIRHPNVAETFEHGQQDGVLYLVMEWVEGEPLDQILRAARPSGGIPLAVSVHLIAEALGGLQAAHAARNAQGELLGLVHRDISPQNLLVTFSGAVKLVDFGVAKATQQMSPPTALGEVKGKFAYMSPEQVQGEQVDARADVFAMGIVLYRVTTGRHPFKADNPAATIRNILMRGPTAPSRTVAGYPAALEQVVLKALARDKRERFGSAEEMKFQLEQTLPASVLAVGQSDTEALLRRLFETRIEQRTKALRAAVQAIDADPSTVTGLEYGKMFPRSQPTMRAVALAASESPPMPLALQPGGTAPSRPTGKRRAWPAVIAVAAGLVLPLVFEAIESQKWSPRSGYHARLDAPSVERTDAGSPVSTVSPAPVAGEKAQTAAVPNPNRDASVDDENRRGRVRSPKKPGKSAEERR